ASAPAGASMKTRWVSSGNCRRQAFLRVPSSSSTALSSCERRWAQRVEDPCGSASTSTVLKPPSADCAARWVTTVVLPTPPLELATNTVFIEPPWRSPTEPAAYTAAAQRGHHGGDGAATGKARAEFGSSDRQPRPQRQGQQRQQQPVADQRRRQP